MCCFILLLQNSILLSIFVHSMRIMKMQQLRVVQYRARSVLKKHIAFGASDCSSASNPVVDA